LPKKKRPAPWPGVFVCVAFELKSRIEKQHPRTKSPGVTEEFWQSAISQRYACRDFYRGVG
jgi:hypothetical protein